MLLRVRARWLATVASAYCLGIVAISSALLPVPAAAAFDDSEVLQALDEVAADPNLSPERKVRTLKWAGNEAEAPEPAGWLDWIAGLFQWLAGASRLLLWTVIVVLLALFVLFIARVVRGARYSRAAAVPAAPTHVRELDIRPESLPDAIGATALAMWDRNDHRAALALLYRGLLSRLVHAHGVPIRESSTEADCLKLALPHLDTGPADYAARLVRVWQHAVYGARQPEADEMRSLCMRFDSTFRAVSGPRAVHA